MATPTERMDEALASIAGALLAFTGVNPRRVAMPKANTATTAIVRWRVLTESSWLNLCRFQTVTTAPPAGSKKAMMVTLTGDHGLRLGGFDWPILGAFVSYLSVVRAPIVLQQPVSLCKWSGRDRDLSRELRR
jgi:hypothetical protein